MVLDTWSGATDSMSNYFRHYRFGRSDRFDAIVGLIIPLLFVNPAIDSSQNIVSYCRCRVLTLGSNSARHWLLLHGLQRRYLNCFFSSYRSTGQCASSSIRCSASLFDTGLFNSIDSSLDTCTGDSILGLMMMLLLASLLLMMRDFFFFLLLPASTLLSFLPPIQLSFLPTPSTSLRSVLLML